MTERPIFIFAQARSGSTLLQRVINSFDGVLMYGENVGVLGGVAESYHKFMSKRGHAFCSESPDHNAVWQESLKRLKDPHDFSPNVNGLTYDHVRTAFRDFVRTLIHPFDIPGLNRWGFKETRHFEPDHVFDMLVDLFPQASFLFTLRHPVGVIESVDATGWSKLTLDGKMEQWKSQALSLMRYHRAHPQNTMIVRYEDFTNPDGKSLQAVCDFLGYPCTDVQRDIVFKLGLVGGSKNKPVFSPEIRHQIETGCFVPELQNVYP